MYRLILIQKLTPPDSWLLNFLLFNLLIIADYREKILVVTQKNRRLWLHLKLSNLKLSTIIPFPTLKKNFLVPRTPEEERLAEILVNFWGL